MDLSLDYQNGSFIANGDDYYPRWQAQAAAFRADLGARAQLDIAYGPGARQKFDLFQPEGAARGLMVFLHGGYWLACDRKDYSHLAAGALSRGFACAMPSYTLAPEIRISQIVREVEAAVLAAAGLVAGPVMMTGHSAGGHLSARMGCADRLGALNSRLARVVPISPLSDLAPLMLTDMQAQLALTEADIQAESPALLTRRAGLEAHIWVGGQERPAFLWHARKLSEAWDCPWTVDPGRHHFDVINGLGDAASPLMAACLTGI
jgi:acetyl esterase/lipase